MTDMILRLLSLGGLAASVVALGYVVLVVAAALVLLWLLLQGESSILGD